MKSRKQMGLLRNLHTLCYYQNSVVSSFPLIVFQGLCIESILYHIPLYGFSMVWAPIVLTFAWLSTVSNCCSKFRQSAHESRKG